MSNMTNYLYPEEHSRCEFCADVMSLLEEHVDPPVARIIEGYIEKEVWGKMTLLDIEHGAHMGEDQTSSHMNSDLLNLIFEQKPKKRRFY
jgi:hypothetical protein